MTEPTIMLLSPIYTLSPSTLLNMVKSGAARILHKEAYINQMNYFPISDHDTGSNIASLMRFLLAENYTSNQLSKMLKEIADASLIGACGNSGMIFSAFFVGFASNDVADDDFTTHEFTKCVEEGVKQAYLAVQEPVEGTILTVMREWLQACKHEINTQDFVSFFEKSLVVAKEALKKTQQQLPILKRSEVVDAGAYGFVEFIQGMYQFLSNPKEYVQEIDPSLDQPILIHHEHDEKPDYQYCFENLISGNNHTPDQIKTALHDLGNSLVVNQSPSFTKVHLHTNDVMGVTKVLMQNGAIAHQKIDDMVKQWQIAEKRKNAIAIVTDSNADIPIEFVEKNQIHVLPIQIRVGENIFLDRLTINLKTLFTYTQDQQLNASTAAPTPDSISRYLHFLASHYDSIIMITASSHLSSMHQLMANQAAKISNVKISVIDSLTNSVAQGLLVMKASDLISQGLPHQQVVKTLEDSRHKVQIYVAFDEMESVIKSGRSTPLLKFARALPLKPIICLNRIGKPRLKNFAFTRHGAEKKIIKLLHKFISKYPSHKIGIIHSTSLERVAELAHKISTTLQTEIAFIQEASCAIGIHAGRHCIGIGISEN